MSLKNGFPVDYFRVSRGYVDRQIELSKDVTIIRQKDVIDAVKCRMRAYFSGELIDANDSAMGQVLALEPVVDIVT